MEEIYKGTDLIKDGVNELANTVSITLGPYAGTVGLTDFSGHPHTTKDGVSVANAIHFKDPIKNWAANLVKQAAQNTVKQAGDGTTTSIVLAQAFIREGFKLDLSFPEMRKEFEKLESIVLEELFKQSKEIKKDQIKDVAYISSNGDLPMAELIDKAYSHSDIVQIDDSNSSEDGLVTVEGMKLDGTLFDKAFINNVRKQAIQYDRCKFIIVKGKVRDINQLAPYLMGKQDDPIIVMADHFPDAVLNLLKREYNDGNIAIGLLKSPSFATNRKQLVDDIINYTGANKGATADCYVTYLDTVFATTDQIIIGKEGASVSYLKDLEEAYDNLPEGAERDLIGKRIVNLSGKLSIIYVGGTTEGERKERKDRFEDAVLAVKSALEEGVIKGGGLPLFNIAEKYNNKNLFAHCLAVPHLILMDSGPININNKILDPAKVTRCAFQNAISVAKTILTTKAVVINDRIWV